MRKRAEAREEIPHVSKRLSDLERRLGYSARLEENRDCGTDSRYGFCAFRLAGVSLSELRVALDSDLIDPLLKGALFGGYPRPRERAGWNAIARRLYAPAS
jgi:hypothetical protein